MAHGIAGFEDGSSIVTGEFSGELVLGPGEPNETILVGPGIFVARYSSDGRLTWVRAVRSGGNGESVASLPDGSSIVTGYVVGPVVFGEGETNETRLGSEARDTVFIARYEPADPM